MNSISTAVQVAQELVRVTWNNLFSRTSTFSQTKRIGLRTVSSSRFPPRVRRSLTGGVVTRRTRRLSARLELELDALERGTKSTLRWLDAFENSLALNYLDGLLQRLDIEIVGEQGNLIRDKNTDWVFGVYELDGVPETLEVMNDLHKAGCPVQRQDIGVRGSSVITKLTRWMKQEIGQHGAPREGFIKGLDYVAKQIANDQLVWRSYLVLPDSHPDNPDPVPVKIQNYLTRHMLGRDRFLQFLLSLFYPVTDFDLDHWLDAEMKIGLGSEALDSVTPRMTERNLAVSQHESEAYLSFEGGAFWRTLLVESLGVQPLPGHEEDFEKSDRKWWASDQAKPLLTFRGIDSLRRTLLPLIEEHGMEIRLATTVAPINESSPGVVNSKYSDERSDIEKREKRRGETVTNAEWWHMIELNKALDAVSLAQSRKFHQSLFIAVKGPSREQADGLFEVVKGVANELQILHEEPTDVIQKWDAFKAFLPTIRHNQTQQNVTLRPANATMQIMRAEETPVLERGILMGSELEVFREEYPEVLTVSRPFIYKLGGNSVYVGTSGSGKSMGLKLAMDRVLAVNINWYGVVMNNTESLVESVEHIRGWKNLVKAYGGINVHASEFSNPVELRTKLDELTANRVRLVHFMSEDTSPELDEAFLRWVLRHMQFLNPGLLAVDETAGWFKSREDERGSLYADNLLKEATKNSWMTKTSIQALGTIRAAPEHAATYQTVMGLAQAGILSFYTPNIGSVEDDLNINTKLYPRVGKYVTDRIASFKSDPTGPVELPGYAVLYGPGQARLIKIEADEDTLRFFARKDPEGDETYWGL